MLKDAGILFLITLISGALLGLVYEVTKEPIARQEQLAQDEACKEVFADAESFEEIAAQPELSPESLTAYVTEQGFDAEIGNVLAAMDADGKQLGCVITVTDHEGYGGDITFTMGVQNDGTLNGVSILSISETAGLGMRAEEVLKPQFTNKKADSFSYTKTGAASENQIDAISGATITTNAFVNGVNAGLACFHEYLMPEGGAQDE
jgi:electron transport complex protein RnfG